MSFLNIVKSPLSNLNKNAFWSERVTLKDLLRTLRHYHERHGVTILYNGEESVWVRIKNIWLKISTGTVLIIYYLSTLKTFTNNGSADRTLNLMLANTITEILTTEALFWVRRNQVLELIVWCQHVEMQKFDTFTKPTDWFFKKRQIISIVIRFVAATFYGLFIFCVFVAPIVQSYFYGDGYHLMVSFDLKNFSERDSVPIFLTEFVIFGSAFWFLAALYYFSFSFFILLTYYVVGQMELIGFYIKQLDLKDTTKLKKQLKDLTQMHLDVLRTIKKISKIYLTTLKTKEFSLYMYVSIFVFGKELMSFILPPGIISLISVVGLYCYICESMMEAEEKLGNAYYELDWDTAPVASRKLLLIAMQEPEQIRFGRLFNSDFASMERFLLLVRRAYDFSLALLKLSMQ